VILSAQTDTRPGIVPKKSTALKGKAVISARMCGVKEPFIFLQSTSICDK
jgi:hypothetical protein